MIIRPYLMRLDSITLLLVFITFFAEQTLAADKNKCYSCASENMKENFLTRQRGPGKRIREPKLYDNMCDLDTWLIREKSVVDCSSQCFKWQQIVNNSGVYSYATIRGCYSDMYDMSSPSTVAPKPAHTECTSSIRNLDCIDQSTIIEHTCWCQGEYCNSAIQMNIGLFTFVFASFIAFLFR